MGAKPKSFFVKGGTFRYSVRFRQQTGEPRWTNESGQAMTEYIILVVLVGLVCISIFRTLPIAVAGYVRPFYYCLSRPIP